MAEPVNLVVVKMIMEMKMKKKMTLIIITTSDKPIDLITALV